MLVPSRLALKSDTPHFCPREERAQRFKCVVDGMGGEQSTKLAGMTAAPSDQPSNVVAGDISEQFILAEKFDHQRETPLDVDGAAAVLPVLDPIAIGDVIEA